MGIRTEPPPRCLDLGNGEMFVYGTADDYRAAAEWLRENYPDGVQGERYGPASGGPVNMTNYGALAILALDLKRNGKVVSSGEANLRWLIALETFPADAKGWRWVGGELLAESAGVSTRTSRRVRDRLIAAGLLEYRRGTGRGQRSSYRFTFPIKVDTQADHLSVDNDPWKGGQQQVEKVATWPEKGGQQNPATSTNATHALKAFALGTFALEASEVVQQEAAPTPYQIAVAAPGIHRQPPDPARVACPDCGAEPLASCRNGRGGYAAGVHAGRRQLALGLDAEVDPESVAER